MHGQPQRPAKVEVDASHRYGILVVHEESQFSVVANEFVCICGPSGCGKTTLLDMLAGILQAVAGHVLIDGQAGRSQDSRASPSCSRSPRPIPGSPCATTWRRGSGSRAAQRRDIDAKVRDIIEIVGLTGFESYYPHQISGGMKQRVAIARAFATDADLILMDEPFVSLDQPTRERMQREVLDIWRHRKRTVIFVTHNLEEAIFLGDRILILSAKPARIVAELPIELPHPRDPLSDEFMEIRAQCVDWLHSPATEQPAADKPEPSLARQRSDSYEH